MAASAALVLLMEQIRVRLAVEYWQIIFSLLIVVTSIRISLILLLTPKHMPRDRTAISLFDHSVLRSCRNNETSQIDESSLEDHGAKPEFERTSFWKLFKRELMILTNHQILAVSNAKEMTFFQMR